MKMLSGPILADMAANVLAMTLVVLIVLGRMTLQTPAPVPPISLTARPVVPVGGEQAVALLRQRLLPGSQGLLDAVTDASPPQRPVRAVFVLDPAAYVVLLPRLAARQPDWQELTVPSALKTADNRWHPEFLALAEFAAEPDRFAIALQHLLVTRAGSSAGSVPLAGGETPEPRFARWFAAALDLLGLTALMVALWVLARLRRWALTA